MKKIITISIFVFLIVYWCDISFAQPQLLLNSPEIREPKNNKFNKSNLNRFFDYDDPYKASLDLRSYLEEKAINLDSNEFQSTNEKTNGSNIKKLIHVFNGAEFKPQPGIEYSLSQKISDILYKDGSNDSIIVIIQFDEKLTYLSVIKLLELGIKIYEPLGGNAVIAKTYISRIPSVKDLPGITWIGEYKSEYKYNPISTNSSKPGAFIYPLGGDKEDYRFDLQKMGIVIRGYDASAEFYDVLLEESRFKDVAESLWWVKGLHKEQEERLEGMTNVTVNYEPNDSRELIMSYKTSFTGNNVLVGVRDNAVYETHPQLSGIFHSNSELGGTKVHGTHVTGIIAGRQKSITGYWGNSTIKGVAPEVDILFRQFSGGYSSDFSSFISNQSRISNHSYSFTVNNNPIFNYNSDTKNYDAYSDNDDLILVIAAGNETFAEKITNPGTAKNVLTVGAITFVTRGSDIIGERASYSSQGPTADDKRLKPELVAPGGDGSYDEGIVSTSSNPWDLSPGPSGTINNTYEPPEWQSDDYYIRLSGTSMAAPHVAGILAKMQQKDPGISSEGMKVNLIANTIPIKDNSSNELTGYANTQVGYGLANGFSITNYYSGESDQLLYYTTWINEDDVPLYDNYTITVASGTKKLVVALYYNDLEGKSSNSDALKDDLDLILFTPSGASYYAYQYKPTGVTKQSPLEKIVIENPQSGNWTVRVRFTDSPGFGNPFYFGEQRYSVYANAILKTPTLNLSVSQNSINVYPNANFTINPTISNNGGYIAAGVTIEAVGSSSFQGDINTSRYVGNLMYESDNVSPILDITAPSTTGTYTISLEADGINKEFDNNNYPRTETITVNVISDPTISGYIRDGSNNGISGVAVTFSNGGGTATTISTGYYSKQVVYGYTGTATPSKSGWTFSPPSIPHSNVTSNKPNQNYTGTQNPVTISGYIRESNSDPINGVTISFDNGGGTTQTNTGGYYEKSLPYNWFGIATPSISEWSFNPPEKEYFGVTTDLTNQNYTGIPPTQQNPVVVITYPPDSYLSPYNSLSMQGTSNDPDGTVIQVQVKVNNGNWVQVTGTTNWNHSVTLIEGTNTIYAKAIDNQGNFTDPPIEVIVQYLPIVNDYWTQQGSNISDDLTSVFFLNDQLGWAVGAAYGNHATILKTTNGGTDWNVLSEPILIGSSYISTSFFINANTGWIAGYDNNLLKTTNGGVTWVQQLTQTYGDLFTSFFVNSNVGWVGGSQGVILKTTNGGQNWFQQTTNTTNTMYTIYFYDNNLGWAAGSGIILKTTNGGTTWVTQYNPSDLITSIKFINQNKGWASATNGSQGLIYKSTNGGSTWSSQSLSSSSWLYSVDFTDINNGWVVGLNSNDKGLIFNTTDGGTNWSLQASNLPRILQSVFFVDQSNGWAVGGGGIILHYQSNVSQGYLISGIVTYDNINKSALSNVSLSLMQNNTQINSTITNTNGNYFFPNVTNGSYSIESSISKSWGGGNSADALLIMRHWAGLTYLTGLRLTAADVNATGNITNADALQVMRRWAGVINSFNSGDWTFDQVNTTVNSSDVIKDFKGICFGDVNGSYTPTLVLKPGNNVIGAYSRDIYINENRTVDIPVSITGDVKISSMALILNYTEETLSIQSIKPNLNGLIYSANNGSIRAAWASLEPEIVDGKRTLFTIVVKLKEKIEDKKIRITVDPLSEFTDEESNTIEGIKIEIPIISSYLPSEFTISNNYPNPFNPSTLIEYELPEDAQVKMEIYNILGERVDVLVDKLQRTGRHQILWNAIDLPSGVYIYRFTAYNEQTKFSKIKKMLLVK